MRHTDMLRMRHSACRQALLKTNFGLIASELGVAENATS